MFAVFLSVAYTTLNKWFAVFYVLSNIRVVYIIMKAFNGFLITHRQMTFTDVCGNIMLENFIGRARVCRTLSYSWYCRYDL